MTALTAEQARRFLLLWQGLIGERRFAGKAGALVYVRQSGCIQFDPVDLCGKNAELTLLPRVQGFDRCMLHELLYEDRLLVDYPDKNLSILPVEDWPYFARLRGQARRSGEQFEGLAALEEVARAYIREHGPVDSAQMPVQGELFWHSAIHWSGNWHGQSQAARSVLEQMYSSGELVIHHRRGTRKVYDLAERHIPAQLLQAPDPLADEFAYRKWRVLRRIGAVGLMWNRPSDAWLAIDGLDAAQRTEIFGQLEAEGRILALRVEGLRPTLYCRAEAEPMLARVLRGDPLAPRCEVLAPLDCMLWDRKLIRALFGFDYSWEIYTPAAKRRYGGYVLPLLDGDRLVGRIEPVADGGMLRVKHVWLEAGVRPTKRLRAATARCMRRLMAMNGCEGIVWEDGFSGE